jgi:hypothetical protein
MANDGVGRQGLQIGWVYSNIVGWVNTNISAPKLLASSNRINGWRQTSNKPTAEGAVGLLVRKGNLADREATTVLQEVCKLFDVLLIERIMAFPWFGLSETATAVTRSLRSTY